MRNAFYFRNIYDIFLKTRKMLFAITKSAIVNALIYNISPVYGQLTGHLFCQNVRVLNSLHYLYLVMKRPPAELITLQHLSR